MKNIKVLHDFDNAYPSGSTAFKRGSRLILYAISKKIPLLKRFVKDIYRENVENIETLRLLDKLASVNGWFGINVKVQKAFPGLKESLRKESALVVDHEHLGKLNAVWRPELPFTVPKADYHFDQEYTAGKRKISDESVLVFHVDYPYLLPQYIRALAEALEID